VCNGQVRNAVNKGKYPYKWGHIWSMKYTKWSARLGSIVLAGTFESFNMNFSFMIIPLFCIT